MFIFTTDYLQLAHGPEPDILVGTWLRFVTLAELQAGYEAVRDAGVRFRAPRWLMDLQHRQLPLPTEYGHWLHDLFLPSLYAHFAEPVRMACLMSAAQFTDVWQNPVSTANAQLLTHPERPFHLALFTNESEALQWLTQETV
ncbi:hypothetical protein F0P96_07235 [Hymenobacter busanensis]|uniref:Uncharacterized protein n=1 Tax=Hymenobacter busanensis TaxID=2607656 RepID=A0A7L5A4A9_9BACT|nr:hypothetical protein [Hymenobacter busanensis]KAA9338611.1 hypothetical protein F0P96_07235 [Hymenobacter busanensis]QHJ08960.1 hypothetical protein GUY19_17365 [Hymenobacter busanensis]